MYEEQLLFQIVIAQKRGTSREMLVERETSYCNNSTWAWHGYCSPVRLLRWPLAHETQALSG